jgi:hypothetical protein
MTVKTADEHRAGIQAHQNRQAAERREFRQKQAELERYHDLRDEVVAVARDSGLSFAEIHGRCGPTPATLERWAAHEVDQPRLGKMRAVLRICGFDLGVVPRAGNVVKLEVA